jgi:DNA-binding IclR family transcriptional regulator
MAAESSRGTARPRVTTIAKVADLLAVFSSERPAWRLSELAEALHWDLATTHRIANALVGIRLLARRDDDRYHVGVLPLELSAVYLSMNPKRGALLKELETLTAASGLTTQIGVLSGGAVSIVEVCESDSALRMAAMLGERLPLHATAAGKVILAQLDDAAIADLVPAELETFTPNTLATRDALLDEVREVRRTGFAEAREELASGLHAAAVPLPAGTYAGEPGAFTCAGLLPSLVPTQWEVAQARLRELHADWTGRALEPR